MNGGRLQTGCPALQLVLLRIGIQSASDGLTNAFKVLNLEHMCIQRLDQPRLRGSLPERKSGSAECQTALFEPSVMID
jgi:hypothetical protein